MSSRQAAHGGAPEARYGGGQPPDEHERGAAQPTLPAQPEPRAAGTFVGRRRRVLQVVGGLAPGGIENWLAALAVRSDRRRFALEFAVRDPSPSPHLALLAGLGIPVHPIPGRWDLAAAWRTLHRLAAGADAVHAHIGPWSGLALHAAAKAGVGVRIAHGHADERRRLHEMGWWRRPYEDMLSELLRTSANRGLAVSGRAAASLFGEDWAADARRRLQPCGIELARHAAARPRAAVRAELGLGGEPVIIAVGRLDRNKNHALLVDALPRLPGALLLLAGAGELRAMLAERARAAGVAARVRFLGQRDDIPDLLAAADACAHPSLHEGLGLAVVEAQAAGVPCVISDGVPDEAVVVPALVRRAALSGGPAVWAEALAQALAAPRLNAAASRAAVAAAGHDLAGVADRLAAVWAGEW